MEYREVVESPEILREEETKSLTQEVKAETRNTTATRREVLEWWKWDSIGAACEPRCGGCRCGICQQEERK